MVPEEISPFSFQWKRGNLNGGPKTFFQKINSLLGQWNFGLLITNFFVFFKKTNFRLMIILHQQQMIRIFHQ